MHRTSVKQRRFAKLWWIHENFTLHPLCSHTEQITWGIIHLVSTQNFLRNYCFLLADTYTWPLKKGVYAMLTQEETISWNFYFVKSVHIRIFSATYFPAFGLNTAWNKKKTNTKRKRDFLVFVFVYSLKTRIYLQERIQNPWRI